MIKSITLHKGQKVFTNRLYHHKNKDVTYNFTDGINIITGRNGSGKSVLLEIIKTNCLIGRETTYPRMIRPFDLKPLFSDDWGTIPEHIEDEIKNHELPKSIIDWDGKMVHYLTPDYFDPHDMWDRIDNPYKTNSQDLFSGIETIQNIMSKNSKGENCVSLLVKLYQLNTEYDKRIDHVNDVWLKADNIFHDWLDSFPKEKGKPTLLIDELDQHLDLDNQYLYWQYLKNLTTKWQVIVISHSIFAFKQKDVNYINLNKEYFNKINKII